MKRTYVYVDGFNLYYQSLRKTKFKWLNLEALVRGLLDPDNSIDRIRYFTAPVSGKFDPGVPVRQQRYMQALRTIPSVTIHEGNFLTKPKMRPLVSPAPGGPTHVEIWNTEEKGSDVNLATHLIYDAWQDLFDVAVVLSQDTDLNEPVRIVRDEIKKSIGVIVLDGKAPGKLASFGSFVRHITPADLIVSIAMSTVAQRMLSLDEGRASLRYRLLPVPGWKVLAAQDAAFLITVGLLVFPLNLRAGCSCGLISLAVGRYPSLARRVNQRRWRFVGGDPRFGIAQVLLGAVAGIAAARVGLWACLVAGVLYTASLFWGGLLWNRYVTA